MLLFPLCLEAQTWNEDFQNQPFNLRYGSQSPTRIADNRVRDFAVGHVGHAWNEGSYHAIGVSPDSRDLAAYIGGLRHIGRVDLQGHLRYRNVSDDRQAWQTALWNFTDNPLVICDSIPGDATTEAFDMNATAAYSFNERLRGALQIGISTGSRADQNDPRPRTRTSLIPINAGIDYNLSEAWALGVTLGVQPFSSNVDYTNVQQSASNYYFIMKGMGDYQKRTTADYTSYHRDYKGMTYRGALSAQWKPADGRWSDFLEVSYATANEDARDGGSAYEYKGGDYDQTTLSLHDRLQWQASERSLHNLTLQATLTNGKGTWYDQKRETDTEHGNIQYYRVLGSSTIQKSNRLSAALAYQWDLLREGQRDLYAGATLGYTSITRKHFLGGAIPKQDIAVASIDLKAGKRFAIRHTALLTQIEGGYSFALTDDYADGSPYSGTDNISADYTRRIFEYETGANARVAALVDASRPVGRNLTVGLHASIATRLYTGDEEYWQGFDGHSYTTTEIGAYLKF